MEKSDVTETVEKYLSCDDKKQNISGNDGNIMSLVGLIRSKLSTVKFPSELMMIGGLLSIVGGSLITKNESLKNSIISTTRSLIGKI